MPVKVTIKPKTVKPKTVKPKTVKPKTVSTRKINVRKPRKITGGPFENIKKSLSPLNPRYIFVDNQHLCQDARTKRNQKGIDAYCRFSLNSIMNGPRSASLPMF